LTKPYQNISETEINGAFYAALLNASAVVISSHGKTIRRGGTYPTMATVMLNAGRVIIRMDLTNGRTSNGTSTNSVKRNLTNYVGGIRPCKNSRITISKNC